MLEDTASDYLRAVLDKDSATAVSIVMSWVEGGRNLLDAFEGLGKAQTEIGDLWKRNIISIADEHFATQVALDLISKIVNRFRSTGRITGYAVAFSCEGEFHNVGLRMFSALLSIQGWKVDFLGPDISMSRLVEALKTVSRPDLLCVSITMDFNVQTLLETLRKLRKDSQLGLTKVIIGGRLFISDSVTQLFAEALGGRSLADCIASNIRSGLDYVRSLGLYETRE